jgi:hypothetical protein
MATCQKWAVAQWFYDNGAVKVHLRPAVQGERAAYRETEGYDFYVDMFRTKNEAMEFVRECQQAGAEVA